MASESVENYLKSIYKLQQDREWVSNGEIATRLSVSPPSVTRMVKRLCELEWLERNSYHGVRLTQAGSARALRVIRNHRILETYFAKVLGMSWDVVDAEVERLEHVASDALINRMEEVLSFPTQDPHGSPIPDRNGRLPEPDGSVPLLEVPVGGGGRITRIAEAQPEALTYLKSKGLTPGAAIRVEAREPFDGPVQVAVGADTVFLGRDLARRVRVCEEG